MTAAFRDKMDSNFTATENNKHQKHEKPKRPNTAGIHPEDMI